MHSRSNSPRELCIEEGVISVHRIPLLGILGEVCTSPPDVQLAR